MPSANKEKTRLIPDRSVWRCGFLLAAGRHCYSFPVVMCTAEDALILSSCHIVSVRLCMLLRTLQKGLPLVQNLYSKDVSDLNCQCSQHRCFQRQLIRN